MRGLILLDGPDGAGKSTLAQIIMDRIGEIGGIGHLHHLGRAVEGTAWDRDSRELLGYISEAFEGPEGAVVVADRHFIGETIYGDVYRGGGEYMVASRHMDRLLHRFRALRVICAPPVDYVKETFERLKKEREEMYDSSMDRVATRYLMLWQALPSPTSVANPNYLQQLMALGGVHDKLGWYHYDVTKHGADMRGYASFLLHELEREQAMIPEDLLDINEWRFTGYPSPHSVLLVGDKISDDNGISIPFFANHGSSLYLAKTLQKVAADESRIVIANINDPDGVTTTRGLSELCGLTVAMGREAERTLRDHGIPFHARIRHPQHARRFNYNDNSYEEEMREALNGWAGVR